MNAAPKSNFVMLIRQFALFALVWIPLFAMAAWTLSGDLTRTLIALPLTLVYFFGCLKFVQFVIDHGFHGDEAARPPRAEDKEPVVDPIDRARWRAALEALRLPDEYRQFEYWSYMSGMVGFLAGVQQIDYFDWTVAATVVIVVWFAAIGIGWLVWACGGLRYEPAPEVEVRPDTTAGIVLVRDLGDAGETHWTRWRAVEGCSLSRLVRDLPGTGLLPPISGGERQWEVTVDGEPVAVITQSWTGSKWWPEPEWLVDPETPFTGERVTLTLLREPQAQ